MSYNRGSITIEGLKGTHVLFPKLDPDRSYCTPSGIRAAGPARTLGSRTSRARHERTPERQEPEEGEETQE